MLCNYFLYLNIITGGGGGGVNSCKNIFSVDIFTNGILSRSFVMVVLRSVLNVGDLVKVILASAIIYCFDFTVGSRFVALIGMFPYVIIHLTEAPL